MTEKEKFNLDFRPESYWPVQGYSFEAIAQGCPHPRLVPANNSVTDACKQATIARILVGGGKTDVMLIRAYQKAGVINYKVTDMLHFDWGKPVECAIASSREPLALWQLIELIDNSIHPKLEGKGLVMPWLQKRLIEAGPDDFVGFVQAKSSFYPELQSWYQQQESQMLDNYYELQVPDNMQNINK